MEQSAFCLSLDPARWNGNSRSCADGRTVSHPGPGMRAFAASNAAFKKKIFCGFLRFSYTRILCSAPVATILQRHVLQVMPFGIKTVREIVMTGVFD